MIRDTTKKIIRIKNRLLATRSRQKSYADKRLKPLEFKFGDIVLLKVSPWKAILHVRVPEELKRIHSTFHVSNLKKCLAKDDVVVPTDKIQLDDKLHMIEEPVDREIKKKYPHLFTSKDEARKTDIKPIYDEEPMAKVQTTVEINVFATGQQHTEQPELNNEGEVDQNVE
uniref:Putative reverse transcriptase domain-containing protein n=1 Tax=Tanacetum cinerariifolium TaxID=118510 RepID=A0A6L2L919_TANCI|nr:putative reverse transcriptase domain-containing protein [Tanacetum cinerariifolium]